MRRGATGARAATRFRDERSRPVCLDVTSWPLGSCIAPGHRVRTQMLRVVHLRPPRGQPVAAHGSQAGSATHPSRRPRPMTTIRRNALVPLARSPSSSCSPPPAAAARASRPPPAAAARRARQLPATTLKGSGSSFQDPFDEEVFRDFTSDAQPNVTVNYNPAGSGQGQTDLEGQLVDFAGSDSLVVPGRRVEVQGRPFLYIPIVSAPITISYNLSGVSKLQLSAATIAKIFSTHDHEVERRRRSRPTTPGSRCRRRRSPSCTAVTARGRRRTSRSTSTRGGPERLDARHRQDRELGEQHDRRREERGRRRQGQEHRRCDRLRRLRRRQRSAQLTFASIKNSAGTFVAPTLAGATAAMAAADGHARRHGLADEHVREPTPTRSPRRRTSSCTRRRPDHDAGHGAEGAARVRARRRSVEGRRAQLRQAAARAARQGQGPSRQDRRSPSMPTDRAGDLVTARSATPPDGRRLTVPGLRAVAGLTDGHRPPGRRRRPARSGRSRCSRASRC